MDLPTLETDRLRLDALRPEDAPRVAELAGEREVARQTETIPHPYPEEEAAAWIARLTAEIEDGEAAVFGIRLPGAGDGGEDRGGELIGAVGLHPEPEHGRARLGYWIGEPYWGRGYATEAARATVGWGFRALDLRRVHAESYARNPASCRVLEKIGMTREGVRPAHRVRWGEPVDLVLYGVLREDWEAP